MKSRVLSIHIWRAVLAALIVAAIASRAIHGQGDNPSLPPKPGKAIPGSSGTVKVTLP